MIDEVMLVLAIALVFLWIKALLRKGHRDFVRNRGTETDWEDLYEKPGEKE